MPYYRYQANDIAGKSRKGNLKAQDSASAETDLKRRGFSDIHLEESEPPAPPMPVQKKVGLFLFFALVCLGLVGFADHVLFGPPNMTEVFAAQDKAIEEDDPEARFAYLNDTFVRMGGDFRKSEQTKAKAKAKLKAAIEKNGGLNKNFRRSEVLEQRPVDGGLMVKVRHIHTNGKQGSLNLKKSEQIVWYGWKRNYLRWRIHGIRLEKMTRLQ